MHPKIELDTPKSNNKSKSKTNSDAKIEETMIQ